MDYKFRGKEIEGEEWFYGGITTIEGLAFIISRKECETCGSEHECKQIRFPCYKNCIEVHPDSVGMWTGLKDKKGVEIYKGSITTGNNRIGVIRSDEENARWSWDMICDGNPLDSLGHGINKSMMAQHEVIGNTTDNSDLLGE